MNAKFRTFARVEAAAAVLSGFLGLLTLVFPMWIEVIFGADPDGGDGSAEWGVVVALVVATAVFALASRWHYLRYATSG
jgi:hypothetical protein